MKKALHAVILILIAFTCMAIDCRCPFTPAGEFEVWTVYPEDGAVIYESEVTLIWSYSVGHARLGGFFVAVSTSPDSVIATTDDEVLDTTFTITDLELATTYYWKVVGWYGARGTQELESSEIVSFTTADEFYVPGQVHTPTPDSGAIGVSVNPGLAWQVFDPGLVGYDFDLYLGTTTDPPLQASGLSAPWHSLVSDTLDYATLYYWRVVAYNAVDTVDGPLWEFTTGYPSSVNAFALIEVDARQAPSGYHVMEEIHARFDTGVAIDAPIEPLQADSVFVEGTKLNWNTVDQNYSFIEESMPFIENGEPMDIVVYGNSEVPDLNTGPIFPACTLAIISPESFNTVSISGFEVTWDGSECGGTVWLTLLDGTDSTGVWKEVPNDGLDSLTAADLAPLGGQTGTYNLAIVKLVEENLIAPGYGPESLIRSRAFNIMEQIYLTGL
ncbi:MAG: hypothetical protein JSU65_13570 [Candidatus Zixiibacteriota bacterium]|nr:MAG: hypothetical protein JSU65_13570 [candidate division Zixibacteria bacterium]